MSRLGWRKNKRDRFTKIGRGEAARYFLAVSHRVSLSMSLRWDIRDRFWLFRSTWDGNTGSEDCSYCSEVAGHFIDALDTDFGILFRDDRCRFWSLSCDAGAQGFTD